MPSAVRSVSRMGNVSCVQSGSASFAATTSSSGTKGAITRPHETGMGCGGSFSTFGARGSTIFFLRISIWLSELYAVIMCDFCGFGARGARGSRGAPFNRRFFLPQPPKMFSTSTTSSSSSSKN